MPSWGTLVFLCSYLYPFPCMLGFANVADLLLEYMCPHTQAEFAPFEAESDSRDNCLSEMVDFALTVDMSLRPEDGYSHTCGSQSISIILLTKLSYLRRDEDIGKQRGCS